MWYNVVKHIKALSIMERSITMSEKRRDNKNRILRTGESQRKDGRYAYKYIDTFGKPQFVYSWKLVPTDKTPAGKRDDIALREKEKEIQKDLDDGIDHIGKENDCLPTLRKADTPPGKCAAWYKAGAKTAHADFAGG